MRSLKDYVTLAAGLAILIAVGTALTSRPVNADATKQVEISSPLPLPVNLTGSVPLFTVPLAPVEPFQRELFVTIADATTGGLNSFNVENGKRVVIEHIAGVMFLPAGQFVRVAQVRTDFGASFYLNVNKVPDQTDDVYTFNTPMKMYADQNVELSVSRAPASAGSALCVLSVSGYQVNR